MSKDASYFVLLGDLNASRGLDDRASVQRRLKDAVDALNGDPRLVEVTPLRLTAGDEVQGIARSASFALDVIVSLSEATPPAGFTWGLGFGALATDVDPDIALMDGPCFHHARDALAGAKRRGRWFGTRGLGQATAEPLEALMNLMGALRSDWTANQTRTVRHARRFDTQGEVARMLGKADSTVSRALHAAHFELVREGERAAQALLERLP